MARAAIDGGKFCMAGFVLKNMLSDNGGTLQTSGSDHLKGTVKGDIVLYETNFGVTLSTCGNQRTLTSFLGFKKCSLDGLVTLVDAPYRVYDNTVQYRRYLRSKAKREQAV